MWKCDLLGIRKGISSNILLLFRVTPKSENVKRVEIPSASQTPRIPIGTEEITGPLEPMKDPHPSEIDLKGTDVYVSNILQVYDATIDAFDQTHCLHSRLYSIYL